MVALVPGFAHDVFVSYAHRDNRTFGRAEGWVVTFDTNLREALSHKLKRGQPDIWRDQRLSSSDPFSATIREAVTKAATLLVILSENYLESEWCQQELALFLDAAQHTGGATGRLFLVCLDAVEYTRWPAAFHQLLGVQFYEQANVDAPANTLGTPLAHDPGERLYWQRLDDLSRELANKLLQMKQAIESVAAAPDPQDMPTPPHPAGTPAVFLAETTPDLDEVRDSIRRYLEQANIRVLPESYYDRTPTAFRSAMEADLAQGLLFVQLLGPYAGRKTADLPKGYEGLQLDVAEARGVPILRWHAPELEVVAVRDPELLARAAVMVMPLEELKREIVKTVHKQQAAHKVSAIEGDGALVLVNAKSCDEQAVQTLLQVFDRQGIGYDTADESDNIETLVEQDVFHGLMVVYGRCEHQWAKEQVRACRQLLLKKKQRAPVCAVYLGPPEEKAPLGIKLPNVAYVPHHDLAAIAQFLLAVQARVARA
jgi:TIR domain